jgi:hypothetical protein
LAGPKADGMLELMAEHLNGPKGQQVLILQEHRRWQLENPMRTILKKERQSMMAARQRRLQNLKRDLPVDSPAPDLKSMRLMELRVHLRSLSEFVDTSGKKQELVERALHYENHPEEVPRGMNWDHYVHKLFFNAKNIQDCPLRNELRSHGLPTNYNKHKVSGLRKMLKEHLQKGCECRGDAMKGGKEKEGGTIKSPRKRERRKPETMNAGADTKIKRKTRQKKARKEEEEEKGGRRERGKGGRERAGNRG